MSDRQRTARPHLLTRRHLLQWGATSAAILPLLPLARRLTPTLSAARETSPPQTRSGDWSVDDRVSAYGFDDYYQFSAPYPFTALGAYWPASADPAPHLQVSLSTDGRVWSDWHELHSHEHGPAPEQGVGHPDRLATEILLVQPSSFVRCRSATGNGAPMSFPAGFRLVYIDASDGPLSANLPATKASYAGNAPPVVPRAGWGCNERLRFDKNGEEIWPREYYITEKVIVHHTATPNDLDPLVAMRSIYYYHAVTLGWGDIGYNFLIDRNGVIYEGRYGGDFVVGGHAYRYNYGSVGIALLGTFVNAPAPIPSPAPSGSPTPTPPKPTVAPQPTAAMEASLTQLTAYRGRFLNPLGSAYFIDKTIATIVGHRDVLQTDCPGTNFYLHLPSIRQSVADVLGPPPQSDITITGIEATGNSVWVNVPFLVQVTVQNTGGAMIPAYFDTTLAYREDENYIIKRAPAVPGRFRVIGDFDGSETIDTDAAYPYRWGFGRSLNPGDTAKVACRLIFTSTGSRQLRFGIVQEKTKVWQTGIEGPALTVQAHPIDPEPQPKETSDTLVYFPETRHTLRGSLLAYWRKFGGLAQFGYPLTSEFVEISETNDKPYLVQYFERARFEHHPENANTDYEVLLGHLGRFYHKADPPVKPIAGQRFFAETGHNLGGMFRVYWEERGGLFVYGLPLTEEFVEKSRIDGKPYTVQYFERARFEFHPESTDPRYQVLLGHLGRQLLQDRGWLK